MRRRAITIVLACLLTGVSSLEFSQIATAHTEEMITVTFINNDQFIIDDGNGLVIYTDVIQEPAAADPDPDLILITHDHFDHFDPVVVEQMANTNGSTVVGPNYVIDALEGSVPSGQLVRMDPPLYERMNLTVQGINIQAYHGSVDNNSYRFTIGGGVVSIYHSGDNMQSDFEEYILNGYTELYNLDIAMLANWFELNSFNSSYHPDIMIEMHYGDFCYVYENYPAYITLNSEDSWQYQYTPTIDVRFGTTPIIDGIISPGEWDDADSIRFYNEQGEINVYIMHNATTLFLMSHIIDSTYYWGDDIVIGIDTEHNGGLHPIPDDYQFYIRRDVSTSEINRGSGSGWESVPEEEWAGHVWNVTSSDASTWTAELSVSYSFLNITDKHQVMGIQFRSYDDNPQGWFVWPEGSDESWPDSWADMSSSDHWGIEYETKTLYVGGTGAGNYTHIQWAIENASNGDTVYVYNDSSPYYENVIVDKSINLIGENRDTTIIDGSGTGENVVYVNADWVNITGFTIIGGGDGIFLSESSNNNISNNNLSNNEDGISLSESSNNAITNNNASSNDVYGVSLYKSSNNIITNNNVSSNNFGVRLASSSNNDIILNNISNNGYGIWFMASSNNYVTNNNIYLNILRGIDIYPSSSNNVVTGNNILNNGNGISIDTSSNNNTISGNNITKSRYGIRIIGSINNSIKNNNISSSDEFGVLMSNSWNSFIGGNDFVKDGILIEGNQLSHFNTHNIPIDNIVNGKPLYYYKNCSGIEIDGNFIDIGQLILANCSNFEVRNMQMNNTDMAIEVAYSTNLSINGNNLSSNSWYGIYLKESTNSNITCNNFSNNDYGISLDSSSNNSIESNNITSNQVYGIHISSSSNNNNITNNNISTNNNCGIRIFDSNNNSLTNNYISIHRDGIIVTFSSHNFIKENIISSHEGIGIDLTTSSHNDVTGNRVFNTSDGIRIRSSSDNNIITKNNLSSCTDYGIYLEDSSSNIITKNNVSNNGFGFNLFSCNDNRIYHNNFLDNTNQVNDDGTNIWDNGYPLGGNYWSDWTTPDDNSGPNQDQPESDGIVDNPRAIEDGSNQDNYPYTTESGWLNPPEFSPVHNINTGEYFDTIQDAIDDSDTLDGHTIEVSEGTYYEDVIINKSITLIGENQNTTIINGSGSGIVIFVTMDWVNITGFTITGSGTDGAGIWLENVVNCRLSNNIIFGNDNDGIMLWESSFNTIIGNNVSSNLDNGIYLSTSSNNNVSENILYSNLGWGILLWEFSEDNNVQGNIIINNTVGIYLLGSVGNNISGNQITSSIDTGVFITETSTDNVIFNNNISLNTNSGISLTLSSNFNSFIENDIYSNTDYGIYSGITSNNEFFHNNIGFSSIVAYDSGSNQWDNGYPSGGNHWTDWTTPDDYSGPNQDEPESDGIVDDPRVIDGGFNQDSYPFTTENGWQSQPPIDPVHNIDTDEYFDTIQMAIDDPDTQDGHTIEVGAGIYVENVVIDKALTLRGEDKNNTIIDGDLNGDVVEVNTDWVNITGFTITESGSIDAGIDLTNANNCSVFNNNISNNEDGVILSSSRTNNIYENIISDNERGISSYRSNGNNIEGNTLYSNYWDCIFLSESNGNDIKFNNVSNNIYAGIVLYESNGNSVTSNIIRNNYDEGIGIYRSTGNIIIDNTMIENGIYLYGIQLEHWNTHTIETSNNVNGKPVYYWKNQIGGTIPAGAGQVILANCTNIQIENQKLNNCTIGIELGFSSNNTVIGNNISNNTKSYIYLWESHWNSLVNNTAYSSGDPHITHTGYGIYIIHSDRNDIIGNLFWNASKGIWFSSSNWNNFTTNNISNCIDGIDLQDSSSNRIYHNNIIDNNNQGDDDGNDNFWDDGYPHGGNYWSDYSGIDEYSGQDQNEPGSDGIGDTSYEIDIDSHDNYPLMEPFSIDITPPEIISGPMIISLSATGATIVWETDELSDSSVEYGLTTIYDTIVVNLTYVTNHNISLTGLEPNTQYHYRVKSKDHADNEVISGDFMFTTPSPKPVHNLDKNMYYDTIQEAIDDADTGNTIFVSSGIYYENVRVDKTITLRGVDKNTTIIDGGENGDVVWITKDYVHITGFTIKNSRGMYPFAGLNIESNYTTISDNNISNNMIGMYLYYSSGNTITNNNASSNVNYGIYLYYSDRNDILGNTAILNNQNGFQISYSNENEIMGNIAELNAQYGIHLGSSSNNILTDNTFSYNNWEGIDLYHSNGNSITGNTISSNGHGAIIQSYSRSNTFKDNTMMEGGIFIYGDLLEHWNTHDIDVTNRVNGGPVYYWKNQTEGTIPPNAGQVILANCVNIKVEAQDLTNGSVGVELGFSSNNIIINNIFSNNYYGLCLWESSNNHVYHNNFTNNTNQAYDDSGDNNWDNGYPSGGNSWSDYTGIDEYSGPNQNEEGSDGIGDTPYTNIQGGAGARDNYPLVEDVYPPIIQLISPLNNSVIKSGTLINLSISDPNLYQVTYSKNSGPEQPLAPPYEINTTGWTDDNYILEIYAVDTNNNGNTKWFNFTIDLTPPSITLNSPYNNSYIIWFEEINFTISDKHLDKVSYIKDDESAKSLLYPYNIDTNFWYDGRHEIEVTAEDLAGNLRIELYAFTKDTTAPVITLESPENNTIITGDLEINITVTDANLDAVYWRINNETYQFLPFPYPIYTGGWHDGRYVLDILAVDKASIGCWAQYVFTKDTFWPEITLNSPENNTILLETEILDFDISDANLDSVTYSINQDTFQNFEKPYDIDTSDWDDDLYTIKIRAEDDADHLSEKWFTFRIDTSAPSISSTSPADGGSDVAVYGKIVIEFSEPMDCDSVESAISTEPYIEYTCSWTNDNKTLTIDFVEPLEYDTPYQISIGSNAQDMAGRELDSDYDIQFTTAGKSEDEEGFPITLILVLLIAIVAAVVIVALVMAKKKKTPAEDVETVETQVEPAETPQPIQFNCSNCNNLLQVNDTGVVQNVTCPFCSTPLTVQPRGAVPQEQVEEPQPQIQPQIQPQTIPIMCPQCSYKFSAIKTDDKMKVQCPSCGASGTLRLPK